MGHQVTVFEALHLPGGVLMYGIPEFRLPKRIVQKEIDYVRQLGVEIKPNFVIGETATVDELFERGFDSVFISSGAGLPHFMGIPGENLLNVYSANEFLTRTNLMKAYLFPKYGTPIKVGERVAVLGGGNVAMDVTRTSLRCGAKSVKCVYRRRIDDMTAMAEEVDGAMAEGAEILPLAAPVKILLDEQENVKGLLIQPQMISVYDRGRPKPIAAKTEPEVVSCDVVIVAIGQSIQSKTFEKEGIPAKWGKFLTNNDASLGEGVFAGGDCVFGPETVIRAIEAGKVAARNMDTYLGFHHEITADVEIPAPAAKRTLPCGRVNNDERQAGERKNDFALMEKPLRIEEAVQECSRCLCCDHYGMGSMKEGRCHSW
ncbi:MAG TPA: hypothetical protein DCY74_00665 [Clostridiales bacterium]|nr:hypothetical protein [Clostridiales bacterium]